MQQERQDPTLDDTTGAAEVGAPAAPAPATAPGRRWWRVLLWLLLVAVLTLAAVVASAWWWAGKDDSLARTLNRLATWMPADQKLEAKGVQGSLREGGRIDWLRWSSPALQVEIRDADIAWSLPPLLSRELRFGRVHMAELRMRSTPQPKPEDTGNTPLQSLELPMGLDVPVRIERVVWEGTPDIEITELYGHYRYTGGHHELDISSLRYAQGLYEAQSKLQGAAPMQLQAQLKGDVKAALPQQPERTLHITAEAAIEGTLATEAARLHITAQANTVDDAQAQGAQTLAADIQAVVRPWLTQPIEQTHADLRHVDVALFMPNGPNTDLSGTLQAGPQDAGWQLHTQLTNAIPGAWDQQALPVRTLQAQALFDGQHTWQLQQARIDVGERGNGHIAAQGSYQTDTQSLQAQASLNGINPADIYSTLDAAPLSGTLQAQTDAQQQVQFEVDVKAAAARTGQALRIEAARAEGTWQAPVLQVRHLYVDALQAQLRSPSLRLHTDTQHLQGELSATVPGAQTDVTLDAGPQSGQGRVHLRMPSAQQLTQWIGRLPLAADPLGGATLQGDGQLDLSWRGGWALLQQRLQGTGPVVASGLQINAQLQVPQLRYQAPQAQPVDVQQLNLQLSGSPESLRSQLQGQMQTGPHRLGLQTDLTAGLRSAANAAPLDWQVRMDTLNATWNGQSNAAAAQQWQAKLTTPITLNHNTVGNPIRSARLQASAGQLAITPPASTSASNANVQWDPITARQANNGSWLIQSKGRLQGIPLAWVDAFSPNPQSPLLASAGVSGDLVVQGQWDVDTTRQPVRAQLLLERASGDVRLSAQDSDAAEVTVVRSSGASTSDPGVSAGVGAASARQLQSSTSTPRGRGLRARLQALQLQVEVQGNDVRAQLLWDSERAGNLRADVRSQLRQDTQGLSWPDSAPLSGSVQADMPNIGIWALFAPPGWRVEGGLKADVRIAGTRSLPLWDGQLSADNLSILSLLDGVDLRGGRLRARLQGTRLEITELFMRGGESSGTRILGPSGNLTAAPANGGTLTGSGFVEYNPQATEGSGMRMNLQATASQLQVLVRADRQVSISGTVQAGMEAGQVRLGGDVRVDRATIILADASAPTLDSDVFVHTAASRQAQQDKAQADSAAAGRVEAAQPPDIQVKLDLGEDFALQGYGITTRLKGQLQLSNGPRLTGEVYTVNGRYRAWGQALDVEEGIIRFSGPYDNPALNITAVRPNIAVRAGAKVSGSATRPVVTLFSEPEMSDAEKLSWIVMGRSASGGGAEAALLQQAALAMLSGGGGTGNFAGNLGLDEIGLRGPGDDGTEAAVTLGKRLSKDFYVAYEQSLSGAMGTLLIFYDLSSRLTLRGQTGLQSAVDLIYTKEKD